MINYSFFPFIFAFDDCLLFLPLGPDSLLFGFFYFHSIFLCFFRLFCSSLLLLLPSSIECFLLIVVQLHLEFFHELLHLLRRIPDFLEHAL